MGCVASLILTKRKRKRKGFSKTVVIRVYNMTGGHCFYCNAALGACAKRHRRWEMDHYNPFSRGGPDAILNLVPACWTCNRTKSNKTIEEFIKTPYAQSKNVDNYAYRCRYAYGIDSPEQPVCLRNHCIYHFLS